MNLFQARRTTVRDEQIHQAQRVASYAGAKSRSVNELAPLAKREVQLRIHSLQLDILEKRHRLEQMGVEIPPLPDAFNE